jgi:hypothetical protein
MSETHRWHVCYSFPDQHDDEPFLIPGKVAHPDRQLAVEAAAQLQRPWVTLADESAEDRWKVVVRLLTPTASVILRAEGIAEAKKHYLHE